MKVKEFKQLINTLPPEYDALDLGAVHICPDCTPDTIRAEIEPETGILVLFNSEPCGEDDELEDEEYLEDDPEDEGSGSDC